MRSIALLLAMPLALAAQTASVDDSLRGPEPLREFRGVWVATVNNLDWPSRPNLPVPAQQAELIAILDRAASLRMNAIVFQVRPEFDALYQSPYEPWSRYLTGRQGRPPTPLWDPLAFAVEEAHRRGIELHAWINPYRAAFWRDSLVAANHVTVQRPELVRPYSQYLWMDPGLPESRALTSQAGLPKRPWYKHLMYAPGLYTGYGVKTMPGAREAIELGRWDEANTELGRIAEVIDAQARLVRLAAEALGQVTRLQP